MTDEDWLKCKDCGERMETDEAFQLHRIWHELCFLNTVLDKWSRSK